MCVKKCVDAVHVGETIAWEIKGKKGKHVKNEDYVLLKGKI